MKIRTVTSFANLGTAWNATHGKNAQVNIPEIEPEKSRKCRKCGGEMTRLPNTNVWVCHGTVEVAKPTAENPDAKEIVACGNIALSKR